jgi:hypothetical protein
VQSWRRVAVSDGIEVHLRSDVAVGDDQLAALREAVRLALGRGDAVP